MSRDEVKIDYDDEMKPVSGTCSACGEKMPRPPTELKNSVDTISWFSGKYIEHRKQKHSQDDRRRIRRD